MYLGALYELIGNELYSLPSASMFGRMVLVLLLGRSQYQVNTIFSAVRGKGS